MGRHQKEMTPIGDIIANLFTGGTLPFNPEDVDIWKVWDEVVGPTISGSARPSQIKKKRLMVTVSDPIWLQELKFLESTIREKLNRKLDREAVDKIEFRVGPR